jgi:hypothetical protein
VSKRVISVMGGAAVSAALFLAASASAATLIGDYQFQGTRASSGPGATLTDVGAGPNSFQAEDVLGTNRQVLVFPQHSGLKLNPTGLPSATAANSVVTTFRLTDLTGYRRILDWSNGTLDSGIYNRDKFATYYTAATSHPSTAPVFSSNTFATVAVTASDPGAPNTRVYFNGALVVNFPAKETLVSDTLRFFKDNDTPTTNEDSAGAVSCIRVYNGALTDAEVAGIGSSPTCGSVATTPPGTTTRCKKHKKKKRSAEAAKKCKKHKKKHKS